MTLICTHIDEFDVREIQDALGVDGRIAEIQQRRAELIATIARKPAEIKSLENQVDELDRQCNASEEALRTWEHISNQSKHGQQVYAPASAVRALGPPPVKKQKRTVRKPIIEGPCDQKPLTEDEIANSLADVQEQNEAQTNKFNEAIEQLDNEKTTLAAMEQEMARSTEEVFRQCVQLRSQWCNKAIRRDFAAGIREVDGQQDDATFDSLMPQRDHDKLARCLHVHTISSTAYKNLWLTPIERREDIKGFASPEDTGIPALQAHAKNMTKATQMMECRAFLTEFTQLLGSIQIYATGSDDEFGRFSQVGAREITDEVRLLEKEIASLKQDVDQNMHELKRSLLSIIRQGTTLKYSGVQ